MTGGGGGGDTGAGALNTVETTLLMSLMDRNGAIGPVPNPVEVTGLCSKKANVPPVLLFMIIVSNRPLIVVAINAFPSKFTSHDSGHVTPVSLASISATDCFDASTLCCSGVGPGAGRGAGGGTGVGVLTLRTTLSISLTGRGGASSPEAPNPVAVIG